MTLPGAGEGTGAGGGSTSGFGPGGGGPYVLVASTDTVQVLSATVVNDVRYYTLQTIPSNVIASMPLPIGEFESVAPGPELAGFATAIEEVMALPEVIGGVGQQTLDVNGLLTDNVSFTVQYVPPGSTGTSITGEALVPVHTLVGPSTGPNTIDISGAKAIIDSVLADLQNAAGG